MPGLNSKGLDSVAVCLRCMTPDEKAKLLTAG